MTQLEKLPSGKKIKQVAVVLQENQVRGRNISPAAHLEVLLAGKMKGSGTWLCLYRQPSTLWL